MGGHIDAYIDCVSPYSYLATLYLLKHEEKLASHGVTLKFHPVFLGGINVGSGNKPPWTLPAKSQYSKYDLPRALNYHSVPDVSVPEFFPIVSLGPQRVLTHLALTSHPAFRPVLLAFYRALWHAPHVDISNPEGLLKVVRPLLESNEEAQKVLSAANSPESKTALTEKTKEALERGAFGAPWFWVRNAEGKEEPFFGSDRFHFMWIFLGLPIRDLELLSKGAEEEGIWKAKI